MYKMDLVLNNQQRLIYDKTKPNLTEKLSGEGWSFNACKNVQV